MVYFLISYLIVFYVFLCFLYYRKKVNKHVLDTFLIGITFIHILLFSILAIEYFS